MTSSGSRLHASNPTVAALELAGLVASSRRLDSLIGNWSGQFPFDAYRLSVPADALAVMPATAPAASPSTFEPA